MKLRMNEEELFMLTVFWLLFGCFGGAFTCIVVEPFFAVEKHLINASGGAQGWIILGCMVGINAGQLWSATTKRKLNTFCAFVTIPLVAELILLPPPIASEGLKVILTIIVAGLTLSLPFLVCLFVYGNIEK